jgi:hypothetical protein
MLVTRAGCSRRPPDRLRGHAAARQPRGEIFQRRPDMSCGAVASSPASAVRLRSASTVQQRVAPRGARSLSAIDWPPPEPALAVSQGGSLARGGPPGPTRTVCARASRAIVPRSAEGSLAEPSRPRTALWRSNEGHWMKQQHRRTIAGSARICADVCTVPSRQTHVSGRDARHRYLEGLRSAVGMRDFCVSDPADVV